MALATAQLKTVMPVRRKPLQTILTRDFVASAICAWGRNDIDENHFIWNPYGHGWHLDRRRFDEMLVSFASDCGARVRLGARLTGWCSANQGSTSSIFAVERCTQFTRRSWSMRPGEPLLARRRGSTRIRFDPLIGVAGMFSATSPGSEHDNRTLVEAAVDGWWYSAWLPQSRLIVAYMTDADLLPKGLRGVDVHWRQQLERTTHTCARVGGSFVANPSVSCQPAVTSWIGSSGLTGWRPATPRPLSIRYHRKGSAPS